MKIFISLAATSFALAASMISVDAVNNNKVDDLSAAEMKEYLALENFHSRLNDIDLEDLDQSGHGEMNRVLQEGEFTLEPAEKAPSGSPTSPPPPPICGTIKSKTGNDKELGPFNSREFACNLGSSEDNWYSRSFTYPLFKYSFQLNQACEYQFKTPEGNHQWQTVRDVNSWFEQMAKTVQRSGHSGYKVPGAAIFNGKVVPEDSDLKSANVRNCPENYCVEVSGPAIGTDGFAYDEVSVALAPTLVYAFSHQQAQEDFKQAVSSAIRSEYSDKIFLTNHFVRCGCESFCYDTVDDIAAKATCYMEEQCGERTFQIKYPPNTPSAAKVSWEEEGTTKIMDWFSECAEAAFGCTLNEGSEPLTAFTGTLSPVMFPKVFLSDVNNADFQYGLGGDASQGFSDSSSGKQQIYWSCPTQNNMKSMEDFGDVVKTTDFMQDPGLTRTKPALPCSDEIFNPPEDPEVPPSIGPDCKDVNHNGNCMQLPGGTCYSRTPNSTCPDVELVFESEDEGVSVFSDSDSFMKKCVSSGSFCDLPTDGNGYLTYNGKPTTRPMFVDGAWQFIVSNELRDGEDSYSGETAFECQSWECSYGAANFTYFMDQAELYNVEEVTCTDSPTNQPSESPTRSIQPSAFPTMAPTFCAESYLDSERLNIDLAIDLSQSTVRTAFSDDVDIGDYNNDGYSNTLLDAQGIAIEELLKSILASESLNNENCEIHLTSFDTGATDHGVWSPLDIHGTSINNFLMNHVKQKLRAPYKPKEMRENNSGYTNFDAALDASVDYFTNKATPHRLNLLVFLSDGIPNVRGDGDNEGACAEVVDVWYDKDDTIGDLSCSDLNLTPGELHTFCLAGDSNCAKHEPYQNCVRGKDCENSSAATQYDSEIAALTALNVQRLAIGVGAASDVQQGSALWIVDDNPGKLSGVLPIQALDVGTLTRALKNLCILNTEPPTKSPTTSPSAGPTKSPAPSASPTVLASASPTDAPSDSPTPGLTFKLTDAPTISPSGAPSTIPSASPSKVPTQSPTTSQPSAHPSHYPTRSPSESPSSSPSGSPSSGPTTSPSTSPSTTPSESPSLSPSGSFFPSSAPSDSPTKSPAPSESPTAAPSDSPSLVPTASPSGSPTKGPSVSPSSEPSASPSAGPTISPSSGPSASPTVAPTSSPSVSPTISHAPTFLLPDCYDEPKLIRKHSSQQGMCYYNPDMVQINEMNTTETTVQINNVWTQRALPDELRVFVHTNGVDSVQGRGDGFECLDDQGELMNVADFNEVALECYKEEDGNWLAVIDVVITDVHIPANDVPHPCNPDFEPISNSCSWRIVIPCDSEDLCSADPTISPSASPTGAPTIPPSGSPSVSPSAGPTFSPTDFPTQPPTGFPSVAPSVGPTTLPSEALSMTPTSGPTNSPTEFPSVPTGSESPSDRPSAVLTGTPTGAPTGPVDTGFPSAGAPTDAPTETTGPTVAPTGFPGISESPTVATSFVAIFETEVMKCPNDLKIVKTGVTSFPLDALSIKQQNTTSVQVELKQGFTSANATINNVYYQYQADNFDRKCYEKDDVSGGSSIELTIICTHHSQLALLEVWIADDLSKDTLQVGDNATVPECCHPSHAEGTPVTKYLLEIKCVSECDQVAVN